LLIDGSGNVGIGTTEPGALLEVRSGSSGINPTIISKNDAGDITAFCTARSGVAFAGDTVINNTSNNDILMVTGGNVGIGTTSPASKLEVVGTIETSGTGGIKFPDGTIQTSAATAGNFVELGPTSVQQTSAEKAVWVQSTANTGTGVFGIASATGAYTNYGGSFQSGGNTGRGVYGVATATGAVTNYGGFFQSLGNTGRGVYGFASNASGANYGGLFESASTAGTGVYGYVSTGTGANVAVRAKTNSNTNGYAIYAEGGRNYFEGNVGIGNSGASQKLSVPGTIEVLIGNVLLPTTAAGGGSGVIRQGTSRFLHTYGTSNTFIGQNAGNFTMTGGGSNVGIGPNVLMLNTDGASNTALGIYALLSNTGGDDNTAIGREVLNNNTTGSKNTAVGRYAAYSSGISNNNTAIGHGALYYNTASETTAVGYQALYHNTTGTQNTALGYQALYSNTTERWNTAVGYKALYSNSGEYNTAIGNEALTSNTTGNYNTAMGDLSLYSCTNGTGNVAIGYAALEDATSGSRNTVVGNQAGSDLTTGTDNVFLGYSAGRFENGNHKLYIDNSTTSSPLIYGEFDNDILAINGSLGIGTPEPDGALHLESAGDVNLIISADSDNSGENDNPRLDLKQDGEIVGGALGFVGDAGQIFTDSRQNAMYLMVDTNDPLQFGTNNTARLTILNSSGNVGIGTTEPEAKLEVAGTAGNAVYGHTSASTGVGGKFTTSGNTGRGVYGVASATGAATNYGGFFTAAGNTGVAVYGNAEASGAASNYGGYFQALGTGGTGVYGLAAELSGLNYGGYFITASTGGRGVYGEAAADTGTTYGGYFKSAGTTGRAVYGSATNTGNYANIGGQFSAAGTTGTGVQGTASGTGNYTNYGGQFYASGDTGIAVYGNSSGGGFNYGGQFYAAGTAGRGVYASANATGNYTNYGGYFAASGNSGRGVFGYAGASSGTNYGGYFQTASPAGNGLYALNSANSAYANLAGSNFGLSTTVATTDAYAVYARASASTTATYGGYFRSDSSGGVGVHGLNNNSGNYGRLGTSANGVYGYADEGNGYVASFFNSGNNQNRYGIKIQASDSDSASGPGELTHYVACFDYDGTAVGRIELFEGTFRLVNLSDARLKTNIVDTKLKGLDVIKGLKVRDFNWKSNPQGPTKHDFIAQEVREVFPSMVSEDEETGILSTSKSDLIPVLTRAVQEQQDQIEAQAKQIEELKAELAALRKEGTDTVSLKQENTEIKARLAELENKFGRLLDLVEDKMSEDPSPTGKAGEADKKISSLPAN
jgi:hypothetical protein